MQRDIGKQGRNLGSVLGRSLEHQHRPAPWFMILPRGKTHDHEIIIHREGRNAVRPEEMIRSAKRQPPDVIA